jgi:hypothetical protein
MSVEAYRAIGFTMFMLGLITALAYVWAARGGRKP